MLDDQLNTQDTSWALDDLTTKHSWADVAFHVSAYRHYLKTLDIKTGDRISLLMANRVEYIEWVIACLFEGVWLVPVNWHLLKQEIDYIIKDSQSCLLITDDSFAKDYSNVVDRSVNIDRENFTPFFDSPLLTVDLEAEPGGVMMYTSGTTGKPKGVQRAKPETIEAMLKTQCTAGLSVGLDGSGAHLITGPLYHAAPMLYALYDMANGAPLIIMPRFDARQALEIMHKRCVSHSHWVPTMMIRALNHQQAFPNKPPSLTVLLHGAAPISTGLKRQCIDWWGDIFIEYWGGTESGVVTRCNTQQWLDHPGTVGKALPQFTVFAAKDDGTPANFGETGRLCIQHNTIKQPFSYFSAEDKTASAYIDDAFMLGDIGFVNDEGFVFLKDRESHMIISGGVNIYPAEIEAVLLEHPLVNDAAVFGIPHDEWGEEVKAVVSLKNNTDKNNITSDLIDYCRQHMAKYKVPRSVDIIEQLPRFETGKLYIQRLKQQYWKS